MFGRATIRLGIGPHSSYELFLSCADTTDVFCVSVPKDQTHFLTWYGTPLYPWQVRFVRSWNISDNTDKPTRSSVTMLVLSTSFYWSRTSCKLAHFRFRTTPAFIFSIIKYSRYKIFCVWRHLCYVNAKLIYNILKVRAAIPTSGLGPA